MGDDQQQLAQRYWFPYWTSPPQPPTPAPQPAVRKQLSKRDTASPPVEPAPSRPQAHRHPQAAAASRGAGAASPQARPQPTRLSSKPSPSRAQPLPPVTGPNSRGTPAPAPAPVIKEHTTPPKPATPPHPTVDKVPNQKDITIPQEKTIHEPPPPADSKPQSKAIDKEKEERDKEKEKEWKEQDKKMEHEEKKKKEEIKSSKEHGGKLHKELKAGVADMVNKLSARGGHNHERPSAAAGATSITLAGENKGASMMVGRAEADSRKADAASDKERRAPRLDICKEGSKGLTTFVNSNVQVINNSLLLHSSCSGRDPGVHLKLYTKYKKKRDGEDAGANGGSAAPAAAVPKK